MEPAGLVVNKDYSGIQAAADFVAAVAELQPDIIGLSGILTVAFDTMRDTIDLLRSNPPEGRPLPPIIIGGGMIDERVRVYVGAGYWATDAIDGVRLCEKLVAASRSRTGNNG